MDIPPLHLDGGLETSTGFSNGMIIQIIFYAIGIFGLVFSLIFSCLIRRPRENPNAIAFKSLFVSIICFFIYLSLSIAHRFDINYDKGTTMFHVYIRPYGLLHDTFSGLNAILLQNVLYNLTNAYNLRHGDPVTRQLLLSRIHAVILSVVLVPYAIGIICDIAMVAKGQRYDQLVLARAIIFFIPPLEIIIELSIIFWKPRNVNVILTFKNGTITLLIGASFFFILSLYNLIHDIEYYVAYNEVESYVVHNGIKNEYAPRRWHFEKVDSVVSIVDGICIVGIYAGIIHCCMQLHRPCHHDSRRYPSTEDERSHMLPPSREESHDLYRRPETTEILSGQRSRRDE